MWEYHREHIYVSELGCAQFCVCVTANNRFRLPEQQVWVSSTLLKFNVCFLHMSLVIHLSNFGLWQFRPLNCQYKSSFGLEEIDQRGLKCNIIWVTGMCCSRFQKCIPAVVHDTHPRDEIKELSTTVPHLLNWIWPWPWCDINSRLCHKSLKEKETLFSTFYLEKKLSCFKVRKIDLLLQFQKDWFF